VFAHDPSVLVPAIVESSRIKADVVSKDEREGGLRRILNYGHTIGHALEAVTNYRRFRHGEAIAYGMLGAADLAHRRGALSQADREALAALIKKLGKLPSLDGLPIDATMDALRRDKKVVNGRLHYVLATSIGETQTVDDVTEAELRDTLDAAQKTIQTINETSAAARTFIASNGGVGEELVETMRQLSETADAVKRLAEFLERNPNALITGRKRPQ
jgi:3-dehydroquinate synthase